MQTPVTSVALEVIFFTVVVFLRSSLPAGGTEKEPGIETPFQVLPEKIIKNPYVVVDERR